MDRASLVATARLYGDAVAIVDPLRVRLWTDCGLTMPQLRLLFMMRDEPGITGGSLAERFSVFRAGFQSAADPRYTVGPQRERVAGRSREP